VKKDSCTDGSCSLPGDAYFEEPVNRWKESLSKIIQKLCCILSFEKKIAQLQQACL
jgi:hypothetical protein